MSNGYVLAAEADAAAAREIADGFGLDLAPSGDADALAAQLAQAANVGVLLSTAAAADQNFIGLMRIVAARLERAQLIISDEAARAAFAFIPESWPLMSLATARSRIAALRGQQAPPPPPPAEEPPAPEPAPVEEPPKDDPIAPEPPVVEEPIAQEPEAEAEPPEAAAEDEDGAPGPEAVRAFVRETMRAYYDDKPRLAAVTERADSLGLAGFANEVASQPDADDSLSEGALVVHALMQLALAALHARGVNVMTAGFGAVSAEAARLAGAADVDALADHMLAASEQDHDPMMLVASAAEMLAREAGDAPLDSEEPQPDASSATEPAAPEPELAQEEQSEALREEAAPAPQHESSDAMFGGAAPAPAPKAEAPVSAAPPPAAAAPAPEPQAPVQRARQTTVAEARAASAPADATAFAPKKLRRDTPELVRITIHQPKDLKAVIKAARKADPRTEPAPQSMSIGDVAIGAKIGVALDVKGAMCDGALQRQAWTGAPLDFCYTVEAEADVQQAVFIARVFIDDAQIGVLAFTRKIVGAAKKAAGVEAGARLKRHKRVFLSYSSKDRETVAQIATAYQSAGVPHFFDRTALKSGEQWSPRLRKEIERSDLFHLCWSKAAAGSEWVEKEASHALTRQRRSNGKTPAITVQMLDGPPWAPHPAALDSINFDDFVRAAIVGYARGDGES